ncbi:MAG: hypothetical protein U1E73_06635 [Planctomycetota bacterium]
MTKLRSIAAVGLAAAGALSSAAAQQLVRDIEQSATVASSSPHGFVATPTFAGFTASTSDSGSEPWITDGTVAGTFRLRDLVPGIDGSNPIMVSEYQGGLLFTATVQSITRLYRTDGTTAGTTRVDGLGIEIQSVLKLGNGTVVINSNLGVYATDLTPAGTVLLPGMRRFAEGVSIGGISYGSCQTGSQTFELWKTDGTPGGTAMIAALQGNTRPGGFLPWNGRIYFGDLTGLGTSWISSTNGSDFVHHVTLPLTLGNIDRMFVRNNGLCFDRGGLFWVSDLTQAGTGFLSLPCNDVRNTIEYNGVLYFRAVGIDGYELWQTDATVAGTVQIADLMPGGAGSHPEHFLPTANGLYFRALLPTGRRLLRLDNPTTIVDLGAIPSDAPTGILVTSPISGFVPFQGRLLFGGTDQTGDELWNYDGQNAPARFADLATDGPSLLLGRGTAPAVRELQYFTAYEPATGLELYRSDGTAAGTQVLDLVAGSATNFTPFNGTFARYGNRLAFANQRQVAITDGTLAGTVDLIPQAVSSNTTPFLVEGDELWFLRNGTLYRSNGTPAGTAAILQTFYFSPTDFLLLTHHILYASYLSVFSTTGTGFPESLLQTSQDRRLYRLGDDLAVIVDQYGIWATDGTAAGTTQLANVAAFPDRGALRDGILHQIALQTYWTTDGTAAGTHSMPLPQGLGPTQLILTARDVYLVATTAAEGKELWRLDAGTSQFVLVRAISPGPTDGVLSAVALGTGDLVLLTGFDDANGVEPWITDGTTAGTHLLADINPGRANSNPVYAGIADAAIYLFADDGVHGRELMRMPLGTAQAASVQSYGMGCLGSAGIPHLTTTNVPAPGSTFDLQLAPVRNLTPTALGFALQYGSQPLGSCELLLGGAIATMVHTATLSGTADYHLPLPNTPQLVGLRLCAQGFALDGLVPGGFTASDGVIVVPGR